MNSIISRPTWQLKHNFGNGLREQNLAILFVKTVGFIVPKCKPTPETD